MHDVAVIGAGISGLALAGALRDLGFAPVVLERSQAVGGRCATLRVDGRPVDHGVPFLHGRDPKFVAALEAVTGATPILGWPRVREGTGTPCRREAFLGGDYLVAFQEGVSRFPERLAQGIDVRLNCEVRLIRRIKAEAKPGRRTFELELTSGEMLHSRSVALTMPVPRAARLLETLTPPHEFVAQLPPLLEQVRTAPCATIIATYPSGTPRPVWDIAYPPDCEALHAVVNDSSKRAEPEPLTLVVHGRARFSRESLAQPVEEWSRALLADAARAVGRWVEHPASRQVHTWHHAMVQPITELAAPLALRLDQGEVLGICGDGFGPEGGLEGAYRSGIALATRMAELTGAPSHV